MVLGLQARCTDLKLNGMASLLAPTAINSSECLSVEASIVGRARLVTVGGRNFGTGTILNHRARFNPGLAAPQGGPSR